MAILAFDTCFGAVSVAVRYRTAAGDWLAREAYETLQTGHAERLMPMIAEVMAGARLEFSAIGRFAVTIGPGTFTGVRVGVSAARAFALAASLPVIGIPSLEVMAARARHLLGVKAAGRTLLVAVDARRGGLYCSVNPPGDAATAGSPLLLTAETSTALALEHKALVVGSGASIVSAHAAALGHTINTDLPTLEPHARFLAELAADRTPSSEIAPLYLRAPDVKPQPAPVVRQS